MSTIASMFAQSFFHGTKADLKPGDLIAIGHQSNFTEVHAVMGIFCRHAGCCNLGRRAGRRRWKRTDLCRGTNWADRG